MRAWGWRGALALMALAALWTLRPARAETPTALGGMLVGQVFDAQGQPVDGARVWLALGAEGETVLSETETQPDGSFALRLPASIPYGDPGSAPRGQVALRVWEDIPSGQPVVLGVSRDHFEARLIPLSGEQVGTLRGGEILELPPVSLQRHIGIAFWTASLIFVGVLFLIASGKMHNTLATLTGAALVFAVSYLGDLLVPEVRIFDFEAALRYVDWNVIFLILGMMIVIAVVERTGIFQWMAYRAYRVSGGRLWLLLPILMLITGVASAFLDNVTTMLLMTPITIQIALAVGADPLALLLPEVFASNVVGISTLIGTPTNILIGSYAGISFNDFLHNLTPGVALAFVGLIAYSEWVYREELHGTGRASPLLLQKLSARARITDPDHLRKAGWVGAGMLLLFAVGERIHLLPAVTALMGATALLVWIRPDIEEMIEAVDWTTLVFFITLFIVVGAIREVGVIAWLAARIGEMVGGNLPLAMGVVLWSAALLSTVIPNIPFTAAMLPVIGYLTNTIPGADNLVLFYCLSVGAAMGGNGSLIGASANLVTAGIAERAGYPVTYREFLKRGLPALLLTVGLAMAWLWMRF